MSKKTVRNIKKMDTISKRFMTVIERVDPNDIEFGQAEFHSQAVNGSFVTLEFEEECDELIYQLREIADELERGKAQLKNKILNRRIAKIISSGGLEAEQLIEIIASKEPITEFDTDESDEEEMY